MRIGICSVGTEVVLGDQVDTNAAWLAQEVRALGGEPVLHAAAPDVREELAATLRWLLDRTDGVIVGGGLGPTPDDLTREAVADVAKVELELRLDLEEMIRERFAQLGARMTANNLAQARVPVGAEAWPPAGTAPGFRVVIEQRPVWVLPGVPWELKQLFNEYVAPDLLGRAGGRAYATRVVHIGGMGESALAATLADIEADAVAAGIDVAYLATRHEVQVKLTASGPDVEAARAATQPWIDAVCARLGSAVAGVDAVGVEQAVLDLLQEAGATVASVESATAGQVAARLADPPGASKVFRGGMVVYQTDTKSNVAGIDPALLDRHPPVSAEVTAALAEAVRERFAADYGIATTGVAGPEEQDGVPVGQGYWAVAGPDGRTDVFGRNFRGDREAIKGRLATAAMEALRRRLLDL
jgi:nicotinamide-nucleotide amidase